MALNIEDDFYYEHIELNKVCFITNVIVGEANKNYNKGQHKYELRLTAKTMMKKKMKL